MLYNWHFFHMEFSKKILHFHTTQKTVTLKINIWLILGLRVTWYYDELHFTWNNEDKWEYFFMLTIELSKHNICRILEFFTYVPIFKVLFSKYVKNYVFYFTWSWTFILTWFFYTIYKDIDYKKHHKHLQLTTG